MKPWSQDWLIAAGSYPGFCSMNQLEVFLLPLAGRDASPSQVTSPQFVRFPPTIRRCSFILVSRERHCESRVSTGQGSNPDHSLRERALRVQLTSALTLGHCASDREEQGIFSNYFQGTRGLMSRLLGTREHRIYFK